MIEAIKAIWNGLRWFFGVWRGLLEAGWAGLTGLVAVLSGMWVAVSDGVESLVTWTTRVWSVLSGSKDSFDALTAAGVPAPVLQAANYGANFVPISWILGQCVLIFSVWVACNGVRIIKSWLPTVN